MIEVQSLTRRYGDKQAVAGIDFSIGDREIVGLLGHNGAGKTTIMRMLSGFLEPSTGQITLDGEDVTEQPQALQQQLGYLPENLPVYPDMVVADFLEYAATCKDIDRSERLEQVREALVATDLQEQALQRIDTLSRGMRQRVGVAQAILGTPRLLILDEPTNGLDPQQTQQMRELLRRLARSATVILSTHILQEVNAVCDRVLVLRKGQLALDKPLQELQNPGTLHLHTDGEPEPLSSYLARLPQVASLHHTQGDNNLLHFELCLHEGADMDTAASNVATCVVNAGARLYRLNSAPGDLEQVLAEFGTNHDS